MRLESGPRHMWCLSRHKTIHMYWANRVKVYWHLQHAVYSAGILHSLLHLSYLNVISLRFSSVQSLSCVWLCDTWIAAHQASVSITNSRSLLKLMPIESVMPSSHLILCHPLLLLPPIPASIRVFSKWVSSSHEMAKVLEFQLHHQSFQWTPRTDLL